MATLSEYLRNRGLTLEAVEVEQKTDPILADANLVKEAAEMWNSKERLLKMVIQARVNAIGNEILKKCSPEEVMVYRQALVEVGAILDDFQKYVGENQRINKPADNTPASDDAEAQPDPPQVEEGKEGSL